MLRTIDKEIDLDKARRLVRAARAQESRPRGSTSSACLVKPRRPRGDTIRFAADLRTDLASFGLMVPYPDTVVYDMSPSR